MKYYISISRWNLLESFVTESISPVSFYAERAFGNSLSRYMEGKFDRSYQLILSLRDCGGDYSIEIDESLIDSSMLQPVKDSKTLFSYPQTIYYRCGMVRFRFSSADLLNSLIAESQILFEVKCVVKYQPYFFVKGVKPAKLNAGKAYNEMSFDFLRYIAADNRYNYIKGAVLGYTRGVLTGGVDISLRKQVNELKNSFAGLNTQLVLSDSPIVDSSRYFCMIEACKKLYKSRVSEPTQIFDVVKQRFQEIVKLTLEKADRKLRLTDMEYIRTCSEKRDNLTDQIERLEQQYHILEYRHELKEIKQAEKKNGEEIGKSRSYFKKGSAEYDKKQYLKEAIKHFEQTNIEYLELSYKLMALENEMKGNDANDNSIEAAIQALFTRISDLMNDLVKKIELAQTLHHVDMDEVAFNDGVLEVKKFDTNPIEMAFFNIVLNYILKNPVSGPLSDPVILDIVVKCSLAFSATMDSKKPEGVKILNCMREFWQYKTGRVFSLTRPDGMPVLESIMGFLLKPNGFDQIERILVNRGCTSKEYALMLWGACLGYAALPKTFTNVVYSDFDEMQKMENFLWDVKKNLNANDEFVEAT